MPPWTGYKQLACQMVWARQGRAQGVRNVDSVASVCHPSVTNDRNAATDLSLPRQPCRDYANTKVR